MPIGRNASPAQTERKPMPHDGVLSKTIAIDRTHAHKGSEVRSDVKTRADDIDGDGGAENAFMSNARREGTEPGATQQLRRGASRRSWSPGPCHVFRIWWKCHTGDPLRVGCTRARAPHELLLSHFSCVSAFLARLAKLCVTHDISSTLTSASGAIERDREKETVFLGKGMFRCEIMYVHTKSTLWIVTDTVDTGSLRRAPPSGWFGLEYSWLELYATRMAHEVTRCPFGVHNT